MVRVAIIGIGFMGKLYAQMLDRKMSKDISLVAVVCRSDSNKQWVRDNLSEGVLIYTNTDELYEHVELFDAVIIVTPHKEHPRMVMEAFHHGKHVLCDKPAATSASEAHAMYEASKKVSTVYALLYHNRTCPGYQELKRILRDNELGDITRVFYQSSKYYRTKFYHKSGAWRSSFAGEGGGLLINQAQHCLDIWQWLFGMPESVYADLQFGKYNDISVEDEATILMRYPNRMTGTLIVSSGEAFPGERIEIVGTKGKVILEDTNRLQYWKNDIDSRIYSETTDVMSTEKIKTEYKVVEIEIPRNPYAEMFQNFSDAVLKGESLIAPGEEGEKSLMISNAAYLSAWNNVEVKLPISAVEFEENLKRMTDREEAGSK